MLRLDPGQTVPDHVRGDDVGSARERALIACHRERELPGDFLITRGHNQIRLNILLRYFRLAVTQYALRVARPSGEEVIAPLHRISHNALQKFLRTFLRLQAHPRLDSDVARENE